MRAPVEVYDALACLLTYPESEGTGMRYGAAIEVVASGCPEAAADLARFAEGIDGLEPGALEELYTRTFDNVADRSLEIGWQLFGENYARGALMVRFRGLLREYSVPEGPELPDHMSHVLPLLGRMPEDLASGFAKVQVQPGVEKMLEGLRTIESPWLGVLEATQKVLARYQRGAQPVAEVTP